jgi:hypothetical protein
MQCLRGAAGSGRVDKVANPRLLRNRRLASRWLVYPRPRESFEEGPKSMTHPDDKRRVWALPAVATLLVVAWFGLWPGPKSYCRVAAQPSASSAIAPIAKPVPEPVASVSGKPSAAPLTDARAEDDRGALGKASILVSWGAGSTQLGRDRPNEGNPEAPMAFAFGPNNELWMLDQVNARIVVRSAEGDLLRTLPVSASAQDIVVSDRGYATLDRHGDKEVALYNLQGKLQERRPVRNGGELTGLFGGQDRLLYVERAHGMLEPLAAEGADAGAAIPGRPSRDGKHLLSAWIADRAQGTTGVTVFGRLASGGQKPLRTSLISTPQVRALAALESDETGTLVLVIEREVAPSSLVARYDFFCMNLPELSVRNVLSRDVPAFAEEVFREVTVRADGLIGFAHPTDAGMVYDFLRCPPRP